MSPLISLDKGDLSLFFILFQFLKDTFKKKLNFAFLRLKCAAAPSSKALNLIMSEKQVSPTFPDL